jgi:hypothetical protein
MKRTIPCVALACATMLACRDDPRPAPIVPDGPAAPSPPNAWEQAAADFFAPAFANRWADAYERTSRAYRERVTVDEFSAAMAKDPYYRSGAKFDTSCCRSSAYVGQVARVEGILSAPDGMAWTTAYLSFEGGHWLVSGLNVGGLPGLPSPPPVAVTPSKSSAPRSPAR